MAESAFVNDGMYFNGEVKRRPGVHPGCTFKYRPATYSIRTEYGAAAGAESRAQVAAEIISRQVKDVRFGEDTNPYRLTPAQALTLHADLFAGMFDYVMGYADPVEDRQKNSSSSPESPSSPPETIGLAKTA